MQIKNATPDKFTDAQQELLNSTAEQIIDLEEQIELAAPEEASTAPKEASTKDYKPERGTENLAHLLIVRGRRFDENTGKEISTPYVQKFTYGEYMNFIKNAGLIGYTIVDELYNPFKD